MHKILSTIILSIIIFSSSAQDGIGYYKDYYNRFYVFDKGKNIQLESEPVDSIRIGNNYLAYMSQSGNLKIYYNGETQVIEEDKPSRMIATADKLVYKMSKRLMIFENGRTKKLSPWAESYFADDGIVTWQDYGNPDIHIYQNGETKIIESGFSVKAINDGKLGKNLFAYIDLNNVLKIFYNDSLYDTQSNSIGQYKSGLNTVAYTDKSNNTFNVFYAGTISMISDILPKSFMVTDNTISYTDMSDNFFMYYAGSTVQLENYVPAYKIVKDNLIVYYNNPDLEIVYAGHKYDVDKLQSQPELVTGPNSALYLDDHSRPRYFYKGKTYENFMTEPIKEMYLYRDLPVFVYGNNSIAFYYDGKLYDYETNK